MDVKLETLAKDAADSFAYSYKKDYESDWDVHKDYINTFNAYEAMLIGQVYDSVSNSVDGSKITDSYAATLAIERAARVMGKLPEGSTESVAKSDVGKAAFMDILRQKWIYPNANAQHSFQTKLRLWQLYSSVYGYMPMFYDWNVSPNGYVGPDCWLWNPRNLIPQQGRVSIKDMDYVTALTWVGKSYLQGILDAEPELDEETGEPIDDGWNREAVAFLLERVNTQKQTPDPDEDSQVTRDRVHQSTKKGIKLATRYEAGDDGRWITFAPDHGCVEVRNIPNPHENGRIPFVIKYSLPLMDSFYGLGDFQRAKPLQFARDGLTNFYFKGIKLNLVPPIVATASGVVQHTLDYREGGVILENVKDSVRQLQTSNAGLSTYQGAMSNMTGSLLSLYGSQNASIPGSESLNPSQGKTPQAIDMYADKEATRDGQERAYLETAIEELTDGFFSLVANIGTEDIPVNLFAEDIEEIAQAGLEDVLGLFTGNFQPNETLTGGNLQIDPTQLRNIEYRFNITPGSTSKINKEKQLQELERFINNMGKFQNMFKDDPRYEFHPDKIAAAFGSLTDIKNADEFITMKAGPSPTEAALQQQVEELSQQLQEMQSQMQQKEQQASSPTVAAGGMMFRDQEVGQAADALANL